MQGVSGSIRRCTKETVMDTTRGNTEAEALLSLYVARACYVGILLTLIVINGGLWRCVVEQKCVVLLQEGTSSRRCVALHHAIGAPCLFVGPEKQTAPFRLLIFIQAV